MASPVPSLLALAGALATPALAQSPAPVSTTPRLTGYVQARFQSIGDSAVFFLRRVRLGAQGNLAPWASYRVQGELRSGGTGDRSDRRRDRSLPRPHASLLDRHDRPV